MVFATSAMLGAQDNKKMLTTACGTLRRGQESANRLIGTQTHVLDRRIVGTHRMAQMIVGREAHGQQIRSMMVAQMLLCQYQLRKGLQHVVGKGRLLPAACIFLVRRCR